MRAWQKNLKKMNPYSYVGTQKLPLIEANLMLNIICKDFKVSKDDLFGESRKRELVIPRHIAQYLIRTKLRMSIKKIGTMFNRDHTSIIHSTRLVTNFVEAKYDNPYKSYINSKQWL